jgi:NAD(P)-dependent dehydrogenase (short-subunit alcohol dehydrogenase family)
MSSLQGRVYAVTGAASGIGRAVAIRLGELGAAALALSDVNSAGLEETKKQGPSNIQTRVKRLEP